MNPQIQAAALPRIAITMGDPAGVGPETIVRAWRQLVEEGFCRPLVIGNPQVFARAATLFAPSLAVHPIERVERAEPEPDVLPCLAAGADEAADVPPGVVDRRGGQAAYEALVAAARLALAGEINGLTTAPLHKGASTWPATPILATPSCWPSCAASSGSP